MICSVFLSIEEWVHSGTNLKEKYTGEGRRVVFSKKYICRKGAKLKRGTVEESPTMEGTCMVRETERKILNILITCT